MENQGTIKNSLHLYNYVLLYIPRAQQKNVWEDIHVGYVASISYGKDSLYMLEVIHNSGRPLDRIITVDVWATENISADLPDVVEFKKKCDEFILNRYGITVEHIKSDITFNDGFYRVRGDKAKQHNRGKIYGFPMRRGSWCNSDLKMRAIRKLTNAEDTQYVGIAYDEPARLGRLRAQDIAPLAEDFITEKDCYAWCRKNSMLSPSYSQGRRDGCWFCFNKPDSHFWNVFNNHPELWRLMVKWGEDSPCTFRDDSCVKDMDCAFRSGFKSVKEYKKHLFVMEHKRGGLVPNLCSGTGLNNL